MPNTPIPPPPVAPTSVPRTRGDAYRAVAASSAVRSEGEVEGTETVDTRSPYTFAWDYTTRRTELRILYERSKDLMWNARTSLAWETPVDPEREIVPDPVSPLYQTRFWKGLDPKRDLPRVRRHSIAYLLSSFLHGEQAALVATSQIVAVAPSAEVKLYAAAQVYDEARHVEVYDRYLREKIRYVYPIDARLRGLFDRILTDERWDMKLLGMQVFVEGLALGAFGMLQEIAREPLIRQITQAILRDEARHIAFGVQSLTDVYRELSANELREREELVIFASRILYDQLSGHELWERLGLPPKECAEAMLASAPMQLYRKLTFGKIVPNVKRLGLLTPHVRKAFDELGVSELEDLEASA